MFILKNFCHLWKKLIEMDQWSRRTWLMKMKGKGLVYILFGGLIIILATFDRYYGFFIDLRKPFTLIESYCSLERERAKKKPNWQFPFRSFVKEKEKLFSYKKLTTSRKRVQISVCNIPSPLLQFSVNRNRESILPNFVFLCFAIFSDKLGHVIAKTFF